MKLSLKNLGIPKTEIRSFILTLTATLAGVFIAIILTNSGVRKKEKEDTVKLLNTSKLILININEYSQGLQNTIEKHEKDTTNINSEKISRMKKANPIPFPDLLEPIITNQIVSKNISEYSHNQIYTGLINLKKLANYQTIDFYKKTLTYLIEILNIEIQFQKGELDKNEIENKMKILLEKWTNNQNDNELEINPE